VTEPDHDGHEEQSLIDRVTSIARRVGIGNGTSIVKVELAGGGAGIWIACTAAVLACFAAILMAIALLYVALQQANHGHQLNAIYRVAPTLEQQVKADLANKEEDR
jgi:hypothetical protein